jgi:hypothetical protein
VSDAQKLAETVAAEFESAWTGSRRKAVAALAELVRLAERADALETELHRKGEALRSMAGPNRLSHKRMVALARAALAEPTGEGEHE